MCPAGAVPSHQVHQFMPAPTLAVVCRTLSNVTDITNSRAEPYFKSTRRLLGELLKVNTANWQLSLSNTRCSTNTILSQENKDSELPCLR